MNRGSHGTADAGGQGADGFNEAPIHESGKYPCSRLTPLGYGPASMRPRFMNRGSRGKMPGEIRTIEASMRPRFMNRGSDEADLLEHHARGSASMRPRFMNRGSDTLSHAA